METKKFSELSGPEQTAKIEEIGALLESCGLGHVKVVIHRETVCPLKANVVEDGVYLSVKEQLSSLQQSQADDFNAKIGEITKGLSGCEISVSATLSAGDDYKTITDIMPMSEETPCNLEHDGKVWLIDFWATWCPPCQKPMAHNQEILEKKGDEWKDKIRIIGLSID